MNVHAVCGLKLGMVIQQNIRLIVVILRTNINQILNQ